MDDTEFRYYKKLAVAVVARAIRDACTNCLSFSLNESQNRCELTKKRARKWIYKNNNIFKLWSETAGFESGRLRRKMIAVIKRVDEGEEFRPTLNN